MKPIHRNVTAAVLTLVAVLRIAATHEVFSETMDEAMHVACGVEWLDRGEYWIEPQHPPLARVMAAMGPWMRGARVLGTGNPMEESREVLHAAGRYEETLRAARWGVLPFFVAACVMVWLWSTRLFGDWAGLLALALFTNAPPVLAQAGLATTDMGAAAAFVAGLWAFVSFVEKPSRRGALVLGVCTGLALLTKFSLLPFLGLSYAGMLALRGKRAPGVWREWGVALAVTAFVIWGGYRCSVGSFTTPDMRYGKWVKSIVGESGAMHALTFAVLDSGALPAPEFFRGLDEVGAHNLRGHRSYLLGEAGTEGWWYFFPVALAVKTPLPLLIAGLGGLIWLAAGWRKDWRKASLAVAFALVLGFSMTARINIGVRHVLPLYPLLAMAGGALCMKLVRMGSRGLWAVVLLFALLLVPVAFEHPDYLAYFNVVAGSHPEDVLVDSDLDWGQDVLRLRDTLQRMGIRELGVVDLGSADLARLGLPRTYFVKANTKPEGYLTISWYSIKVRAAEYGWLEKEMPVEWVGRSILLYRF